MVNFYVVSDSQHYLDRGIIAHESPKTSAHHCATRHDPRRARSSQVGAATPTRVHGVDTGEIEPVPAPVQNGDVEQPADIRVVTRTVEVDKPTIRTVVISVPVEPRTAEDWAVVLEALATRLAQGRIYRRDLPTLIPAMRRLVEVWNRTIEQAR